MDMCCIIGEKLKKEIEKIKEKLMKDLYMGKYVSFKKVCNAIDKIIKKIDEDNYKKQVEENENLKKQLNK